MKTNTLLSLAGCVATATGIIMAEPMDGRWAQLGLMQTQSGGGTPAKLPGPKNPTPPPATNPQQPSQKQPETTPPTPADRNSKDPANPNPTGKRPGDAPTPLERKNPRFFRFTDDRMETKFNESAQRLVGIEQRLAESNKALLTRLGEVRNLPPERQNAAVADLLQDILREQAQFQQYMALSRTLLTGDLGQADATAQAAEDEMTQPERREETRDSPGVVEKRAGTPGAQNPR